MHVPPLHRPGRGRWGVRASCTHLDERSRSSRVQTPGPVYYVTLFDTCMCTITAADGCVSPGPSVRRMQLSLCVTFVWPRGERGGGHVCHPSQSESPRTTGVCLACHVCINTSMASARCWSRRPPVATLVIVLFLATGGSAVDYGMKVQQAVGSVRAVSTSILRPHSLTRPQPRSPTASLALV